MGKVNTNVGVSWVISCTLRRDGMLLQVMFSKTKKIIQLQREFSILSTFITLPEKQYGFQFASRIICIRIMRIHLLKL